MYVIQDLGWRDQPPLICVIKSKQYNVSSLQ